MEMHQVRYFLAVAEELNFTRAAEACNVAQPSLSRAIRNLEAELGGDLFRRERNLTHLTELGRRMLPLLRRVHDGALAAKAQAEQYRTGSSAPLRIGLSMTVRLDLIAPMLSELARAFPGLELHVRRAHAEAILEALRSGDVELGIVADTGSAWERLDRWPLFEEGFVLLMPPDRYRPSVTMADVAEHPLIARRHSEHAEIDGPDGNNLTYRHEVTCDEDAATLVRRGLGSAIVPASVGVLLPESVTSIDGYDKMRTVQVCDVAGRQRAPATTAMLRLLRAADWPAIVSRAGLKTDEQAGKA